MNLILASKLGALVGKRRTTSGHFEQANAAAGHQVQHNGPSGGLSDLRGGYVGEGRQLPVVNHL